MSPEHSMFFQFVPVNNHINIPVAPGLKTEREADTSGGNGRSDRKFVFYSYSDREHN